VAARLYLGTSGYQYDHWRGVFYPAQLPKSQWFNFYTRHFKTVEINNTFYRLAAPPVFDAWRAAAPAGFIYALKFSRYGSHRKKLKDPRQPIRLFMDRARRLGPRLGPILVQLPPRWRMNLERLDAFLRATSRRAQWAFEFRDPSWLCEPIFRVLARHRAALCWHDLLPDHPDRLTAGFTYLRFHGRDYGGSYSGAQLRAQARRIRAYLAQGVDVYAYFNNDAEGYAIRNALDLRRYLE
jgi:uncharacterized protein YecE (DUF72 family)